MSNLYIYIHYLIGILFFFSTFFFTKHTVATLPIKPLSPGDPCPPMTQCALPTPAPEPMMIEEIIVDPVTKKEKKVSVPDVEVVRNLKFFFFFFFLLFFFSFFFFRVANQEIFFLHL